MTLLFTCCLFFASFFSRKKTPNTQKILLEHCKKYSKVPSNWDGYDCTEKKMPCSFGNYPVYIAVKSLNVSMVKYRFIFTEL